MESRDRLLKSHAIASRLLLIWCLIVMVSLSSALPMTQSRRPYRRGKRSFASLKCLGIFDRPKFAELNHVCNECYQLYRVQHIHAMCRSDCFENDIFIGCVDALLLSHEHKALKDKINHLNGNR